MVFQARLVSQVRLVLMRIRRRGGAVAPPGHIPTWTHFYWQRLYTPPPRVHVSGAPKSIRSSTGPSRVGRITRLTPRVVVYAITFETERASIPSLTHHRAVHIVSGAIREVNCFGHRVASLSSLTLFLVPFNHSNVILLYFFFLFCILGTVASKISSE